MSRFFDWTPDDQPAAIVDTSTESGWDDLRSDYTPIVAIDPFERIIEIAKAHGVTSVLVERRYIDADYRSEHSRFYSTTFRRYPSVCHRLHFFVGDVPAGLDRLDELQKNYRGYSVMRPFETAPVGRTMIVPPPDLADATLCLATDKVHLFGWTLEVDAVPFVSQDAQYLRCAHAAEWMVLYHAHLVYGMPRRLPSDIHDSAIGGQVVDRQLPSMGLSMGQMLSSLHSFGLAPSRILLPATRDESKLQSPILSMPAILCRYVNSQMPPIVLSMQHAWVISGYLFDGTGPAHDNVVFIRNDDALGPYIRVADPWNEPEVAHRPWIVAIAPLPQKCYLTAERAETLCQIWLGGRIDASGGEARRAKAADGLSYRTYGISSAKYKASLGDRGLPDDVVRMYRLANWPRYVWVVEAFDRTARDAHTSCVYGELVLDATAHHLTNVKDITPVLSVHLEGDCVVRTPDHAEAWQVTVPWRGLYRSGCPVMRG